MSGGGSSLGPTVMIRLELTLSDSDIEYQYHQSTALAPIRHQLVPSNIPANAFRPIYQQVAFVNLGSDQAGFPH
jgi:hypothetical protein